MARDTINSRLHKPPAARFSHTSFNTHSNTDYSMGIRVELEMLAVLLLLTPLVSDGLVMPKCQVVDQLMSNIPADVPDHDNLVAKREFKTAYI